MYSQRVMLQPVAGKVAEVDALLTDRIKRRQAQGTDAVLAQRLTGAGAAFEIGLRFPDLAAFQAFRTANRASTDFQAYQAQLAPLLQGPGSVALFEQLIAPAAGPTPTYRHRVTIYPAPDKIGAVRELLEERMQAFTERGDGVGLSRPVVSDHGPSFDVTALHPDLAAFERTRRANDADKDSPKFLGKLGGLIGRPTKTELFEILVPFTS
jgi:hypothetical protein